MKKPHFITFEGIDGTGKSTQIELTVKYLSEKGYRGTLTREPGGTWLSEKIRELVLYHKNNISVITELLLFLAARAEHVDELIRPEIKRGRIVLCDRFSDSTMVYQGFVGGIPIKDIHTANLLATKGLQPDLTILLDADPKDLLPRREKRGITDNFEERDISFQKKLRDSFLALAKDNPDRIVVVNANQSVEKVQDDIRAVLEKHGL